MNFLKTMDLYKSIVLLSLILLPLGGWWVTKLDDNIAACQKALNDATRSGGLIEQIGALKKKIEVVVQNRGSVAIENYRSYFEEQILLANSTVSPQEYEIKAAKEETIRIKDSKQQATDFVVELNWNKDLKVKLDYVFGVLFNCESAAKVAGGNQVAQQSVWRLRNLQLTNAGDVQSKVPDEKLEDSWTIRSMTFARRVPPKKVP